MIFSGFASTGNQGPRDFTFRASSSNIHSQSNDGLCLECSTLNLEDAFSRAHDLYEQARRGKNTRQLVSCRSPSGVVYLRDFYFVTSLGKRLSELRGCKLCDFLKQHVRDPLEGTYKVLAICSSETSQFEPPRKNVRGRMADRNWASLEYNVFLAVVSEVVGIPRTGVPLRWLETELPRKGCIYRLTQDGDEEEVKRLILPIELEPAADVLSADYWLYTCEESHKSCCAPNKPLNATLRGFRAINVLKNPISVEEVAWSESYVALSYVWGPGTEKWPQTIKDAVRVTRALRKKYLWVDRLCIDQSNLEEKMYLISRMDAIYEGADLTIVNAAGDARSGLPGVGKTPRTAQPKVELSPRFPRENTRMSGQGNPKDVYLDLLNVPEVEYEAETTGHSIWFDSYRYGLNNSVQFAVEDMMALGQRPERARKYGISRDHLDFYEDSADHLNIPFDAFMEMQEELARRIGITLPELVPWLQRDAAREAGLPLPEDGSLPPISRESTITSPLKPIEPLPPGKYPGKMILVSTMQDPRVAIRRSKWATRGWTYQESALSKRCLVFTPEQIYWECRGMAIHESFRMPVHRLHEPAKNRKCWLFGDYMLSGVFRGDMHKAPELQYGFQSDGIGNDQDSDVQSQVKALDGHIRSFTARELTNSDDSLNAFLGLSAKYSRGSGTGLSLILGLPVWKGSFANGQPGLQHSFAMSASSWFHVGKPTAPGLQLYVKDCPRRSKFPSWSWIGWEGQIDLNGDNKDYSQNEKVEANGVPHQKEEDDADDENMSDNSHVDYFMAMTSSSWATSIDRLWTAQMILEANDGACINLQQSNSLSELDSYSRKWALKIERPLVLKHFELRTTSKSWEGKRLLDKLTEIHLSASLTEDELEAGHARGDMVTVLMFASTVPFVWNGKARFLILRKIDDSKTRWERVGRLVLTIEEWHMQRYQSSQDMVADLPVVLYGSKNGIVVV